MTPTVSSSEKRASSPNNQTIHLETFGRSPLETFQSLLTALDRQYQRHPERFVKGPPRTTLPPEQMSINPVAPDEAGAPESRAVNFPTLTAAKERKIR